MESRKSKKSSSRAKEKPIMIHEVDDDSPNEWRTKKAHDRQAREPKGRGKAIQHDKTTLWLRDNTPLDSAFESMRANTLTSVEENRELQRTYVGQKMDANRDYKALIDKIAIRTSPRINHDALDTLGIGDDIRWYLEALRLCTFVEIDFPAYVEEARQFLSTVTFSFPRCKHPPPRTGVLEFVIDEKSYSLSIPEMDACLGLDSCDLVDFGSFSGENFWPMIANGAYDAKYSKSSMITHPAIRIVHRILASTMFSRSNQTGILTDEITTLQMPFMESPLRVSFACLLASRLVKIKHEAVTCTDRAAYTTYGTVITAIMLAAGVDLSDKVSLPRDQHLDLFSLNAMRIISGASIEPDRIGYLYPVPPNISRLILLPSTTVPRLCDGHTCWIPHEDEFLNLMTGETMPLTIGAFIKKKARVYRGRQQRVAPTTTTTLEEERDRRLALEQKNAAQALELARMRELLRRSGLDVSHDIHDSTSG